MFTELNSFTLKETGIATLRTILLSDVGVLPTHRANLQGSPSTCSVTPSSDVLKKIKTQRVSYFGVLILLTNFLATKKKSSVSYKQLALVQVFAAPVRIFDFFAKHQGHLKQEEVPIPAFSDQSLGIPDLEGFLKYQLSLGVNVSIKP